MTEWFEKSFGETYLELYAHRNQEEASKNVRDLMTLISPPKDEPLLDLCCGAGRYLCALREMGFRQLVGLDLSDTLLDAAAQAIEDGREDNPCNIELVAADMRQIPYENFFGTILSLFTSFGYFEEDAENRAVLEGVYRALKPGGVFVLDYMNRPRIVENLISQDEQVIDDKRILNERRITPDGRRVEKTITITDTQGHKKVFDESVRLYTLEELETMMRDMGFIGLKRYGSFQGEPFGPLSSRLIIIAQKQEDIA